MILISMMVLCTQVNKMYVIATLSACISRPGKLEKYAWPRWDSNLRSLESVPFCMNDQRKLFFVDGVPRIKNATNSGY